MLAAWWYAECAATWHALQGTTAPVTLPRPCCSAPAAGACGRAAAGLHAQGELPGLQRQHWRWVCMIGSAGSAGLQGRGAAHCPPPLPTWSFLATVMHLVHQHHPSTQCVLSTFRHGCRPHHGGWHGRRQGLAQQPCACAVDRNLGLRHCHLRRSWSSSSF